LRQLRSITANISHTCLRLATTGSDMLSARELTVALGGHWRGRSGTARCPAHHDSDPSLSIADGHDGRVLVKCFAGCDQGAVIAVLRARGLWPGNPDHNWRTDPGLERQRREAEEADRIRRIARARRIWTTALPVTAGDMVDRYLRGRGLEPPAAGWPPSIRFLPVAHHPSGTPFPALVAAACRWPGRKPTAVQCLALNPNAGGKANIAPERWTRGVLRGAAVRLAPWKQGRPVVVTEGVEDALAVAGAVLDSTVWAILGNNVKSLSLPEGAEVVLCLDGDAAGRVAERTAASILIGRGHRVRRARLPYGADPADMVADADVGRL
jgi:putative DNA primase/helicase